MQHSKRPGRVTRRDQVKYAEFLERRIAQLEHLVQVVMTDIGNWIAAGDLPRPARFEIKEEGLPKEEGDGKEA